MNLKGKTIVLGITGGIAAYKMPNVAHALAKAGANVHVLMTKNATEFITPLVFETLTAALWIPLTATSSMMWPMFRWPTRRI